MTGSMDNQHDALDPINGGVYVVTTQDDRGTIVDLELLDSPPRWVQGRGQTLRLGNLNGGDSVELPWPALWVDDDEVDPSRMCPGLPGNPPCSNAAATGDRYCAGCRAEFDSRPDEESVADAVVTDEQDERDAAGEQACAHCGAPVVWDETAVDWRHVRGPECHLALAAEGYDDPLSAAEVVEQTSTPAAHEPRAYSVLVLNARNQLTEHEDLTRHEAHELRDELIEAHPGWIARVRVDRDMLSEHGRLSETWSHAGGVPTLSDELRSVELEIQRHRDAGTTTSDEYPPLVGRAARLRALVRRDDRPPKGRYALVLIDRDAEHAPDGDFAWVGEIDVDDVGSGDRLLALGGELYRQIVELDLRELRERSSS
jgi:hypothetical protein